MEGDNCNIEGTSFEAGSQVCDDKLCFVCRDGDWQKKGTLDLMAEALENL